jgi:hypothetical protein
MGGKVYVLSVSDDVFESKVIGVYLHRLTACHKIIEEINKMDEVYDENTQFSSAMKIISQIRPYYYGKFYDKKGYKYDDHARRMYWRISKHQLC